MTQTSSSFGVRSPLSAVGRHDPSVDAELDLTPSCRYESLALVGIRRIDRPRYLIRKLTKVCFAHMLAQPPGRRRTGVGVGGGEHHFFTLDPRELLDPPAGLEDRILPEEDEISRHDGRPLVPVIEDEGLEI